MKAASQNGVRRLIQWAGIALLPALAGSASLAAPPPDNECAAGPEVRERLLALHAANPTVRSSAMLPGVPESRVSPRDPAAALLAATSANLEDGAVVDMGGVLVLVDDGLGVLGSYASGFDLDIVRLARLYYRYMPDDPGTLALLPNFEHAGGSFFVGVRNSIQGINLPTFDEGAIYGSPAALQGILVFSNFNRRPADPGRRIPTDNNTSLSLFAHEFAHQFGAYIRFDGDSREEFLLPSTALLGRQAAHWCFYHDTRSAFDVGESFGRGMSVLEGNRFASSAGRFTTDGVTDGYSALDLYLMGLAAPEEVPPFYYLEGILGPPTNCAHPPVSVPHQQAVSVLARARQVGIQDVIAIEGPRIPTHAEAPRDFRQAVVVVARRGRFPTPDEVEAMDQLRLGWEDYFLASTGGRASVETDLGLPETPAASFAVVRLPPILQAGFGFPLALVALDASGRRATGYQGTVRLSSSDTGARLPADVVFAPGHRGYRLVDGEVVFSRGGIHTLTATDTADQAIRGSRQGLAVEDARVNLCVPGEADFSLTNARPWGLGNAYSMLGGIRSQTLIHSSLIGRPALISDLNWFIGSGPDGVQWESAIVKLAHKPQFELLIASESDLDRNLAHSTEVATVLAGRLEAQGMVDSGRLHFPISLPFAYNGIDHLLVDIRYSGGGPSGLMIDRAEGNGLVLVVERLGPNPPVPRSDVPTICLGARLPGGTPPVLSGIEVKEVTNRTAVVGWRTSPATDGRLRYGPVGGPWDQETPLQRFSLTHEIRIADLTPGSDYEVVVVSRDIDSQGVTSHPIPVRTTEFFPRVDSVVPGSLKPQSRGGLVRLRGEYFFPGVTVALLRPHPDGSGPPVPETQVQIVSLSRISPNEITMGVTVNDDAEPGPRIVRVINDDGFMGDAPTYLGVETLIQARDADGSGRVDGYDLVRLARAFGRAYPDPLFDASVDLDGTGVIDGIDLSLLAASFGKTF